MPAAARAAQKVFPSRAELHFASDERGETWPSASHRMYLLRLVQERKCITLSAQAYRLPKGKLAETFDILTEFFRVVSHYTFKERGHVLCPYFAMVALSPPFPSGHAVRDSRSVTCDCRCHVSSHFTLSFGLNSTSVCVSLARMVEE